MGLDLAGHGWRYDWVLRFCWVRDLVRLEN